MARNIYNILRLGTQIKSRRLKLLGIWLFHVLGKRYIGIFSRPGTSFVTSAVRCVISATSRKGKVCENLEIWRDRSHCRKSVPSCSETSSRLRSGTDFTQGLGKNHCTGQTIQRPLRSLTTNGNLLTKELLAAAVKNGLDELTLSAHGFTRENVRVSDDKR